MSRNDVIRVRIATEDLNGKEIVRIIYLGTVASRERAMKMRK